MGLKRITPNFLRRIWAGRNIGFASLLTSVSITGVIIGGISATGNNVSINFIIICGLFCITIAFIFAYLRGNMQLVPDSFLDEMGSDGRYFCDFCSSDNLNEACNLTKPFYGHEYVDFTTVENWRQKNLKGFVQITNSKGILCACFGILALTDSFMEQFIAGRLSDTQLASDCIRDFEESKKCSSLYISGIIVRDPSTYAGCKRARVMIWAMLYYIKKLYGLQKHRVLYAIGVTKEAERLMDNFGFQLIQEGRNRTDKCNLYTYELSKDTWSKLLANVGDFSMMATVSF